jgi:hypothetical protein
MSCPSHTSVWPLCSPQERQLLQRTRRHHTLSSLLVRSPHTILTTPQWQKTRMLLPKRCWRQGTAKFLNHQDAYVQSPKRLWTPPLLMGLSYRFNKSQLSTTMQYFLRRCERIFFYSLRIVGWLAIIRSGPRNQVGNQSQDCRKDNQDNSPTGHPHGAPSDAVPPFPHKRQAAGN